MYVEDITMYVHKSWRVRFCRFPACKYQFSFAGHFRIMNVSIRSHCGLHCRTDATNRVVSLILLDNTAAVRHWPVDLTVTVCVTNWRLPDKLLYVRCSLPVQQLQQPSEL